MRPLLGIILIIVALTLLKLYVWDKEASPSASVSAVSGRNRSSGAKSSLPVDIYVAESVETANTVYASGTMVPNEEVALQSEVSGRLVGLHIKEGGYVQKGALIAKLNDDDLRAQLKRLEFEDQLASQIEIRQKKLLDINAISKEEYDLAVNKVNTLGADRELLQVLLEKTEVRAPFSGRIGFKNISEGAYVTPSIVIATLVQSNPIKIDFEIPEKYAASVTVGQEAFFDVDGIKDRFVSKVIAVDPRVDEDLRTLRLRAETDNKLGLFKPGMFVRIELPLGSTEAIMVPTESVLPILKGKIVYLMKNGKAVETKVTTGLRTDRSVQIVEGMEVGDTVIVSALMSLKPDLPVKVQELVNLEVAP